ncbi:hypothetical protein NT05LI_3747, partial [Listeria ivanovii FSL F6-596]
MVGVFGSFRREPVSTFAGITVLSTWKFTVYTAFNGCV